MFVTQFSIDFRNRTKISSFIIPDYLQINSRYFFFYFAIGSTKFTRVQILYSCTCTSFDESSVCLNQQTSCAFVYLSLSHCLSHTHFFSLPLTHSLSYLLAHAHWTLYIRVVYMMHETLDMSLLLENLHRLLDDQCFSPDCFRHQIFFFLLVMPMLNNCAFISYLVQQSPIFVQNIFCQL